ncbi:GtrA family protein [Vibrio sp. CAIM 722]|uniref:GtrA family protein n=1 Tax=Vibrio eleionomae TaxID=2653505 RepID=A0A7X4LMN5_9VIBR|nr:GtrA family protein [Vibrio eleionomae]MZI94586.1 GtrA family protein [Vibrio eleionomae]
MMKRLSQVNALICTNLQQKMRFIMVGGFNTAVSYLSFVAIYQQINNYILASILAYCIGVLCSFLLNRGFVFNSKSESGQFIPFVIVNLASLGASTLSLFLLVSELHLNAYLGQFFSIFVSMTMNYLGYQRIFKQGVSMNTIVGSALNENKPWNIYTIIRVLILLVCAAVTVHNAYTSVLVNIAHDALPYMADYTGKFTSEGRWINFALFEFSRSMNAQLANAICYLFIGIFGYNVSMALKKDKWLALLFAMTVMNIPYFTMLFKWPMTLYPGCIMLALFSYYRERISVAKMLLLSGVLLFATYPAFYFVMPLIYLAQLKQSSFKEWIVFMLWWAAGYVLGYAVANGLIYLYTGLVEGNAHFMQMATWRKENPVHGLASLVANFDRSLDDFVRNAKFIAELSAWFYLPALVIALLTVKDNVKYYLTVVAVIISIYASVIVLGVHVPLRSGITLPLGIAMVVFLVKTPWLRYVNILLLLIPLAFQTYTYNTRYNATRIVMAQVIEHNDVHDYIDDTAQYDHVVATVDKEKMSQWMTQHTGSKQFKNLANLEYHMIRPYFYKVGIPDKDIDVKYIKQSDAVKGETKVKIKDRTLYVDFY